MAEAIAALSLVSNIVQLVSFGSRLMTRLNELKTSVNDVPKVFRGIQIQVPLVLDTLQKTEQQAELGNID